MTFNKLWGGVYSKPINENAWAFGNSFESDCVLLHEEIEVTIAHARMLAHTRIITSEDCSKIVTALSSIAKKEQLPVDSEDIHGAIESFLIERIGETAKKLHAGRSRNDQIVTVTKLWLQRRCKELLEVLASVQTCILDKAESFVQDPMPGYTHQQPAQPVTIGFWLSTYFWMLERDKERLSNLMHELFRCPMGAAALSGTSLPIDREFLSHDLRLYSVVPHALDAVSDRDFIGDFLHFAATLMQHLSRLSQELILFSTCEFGFIRLDDAYSTGSSIMPQKKNPDFAELIRGRSARVIGHWTTFMSLMKALPLGYNRDLQDDKPALFDSVFLSLNSLDLTREMIKTLTFDLQRMASAAESGYSTATTVAESLVMQGIPFRVAHELVGNVVQQCQALGIQLSEFTGTDSPELTLALKSSGTLESIESRNSMGGTSKVAIHNQLKLARKTLQTKS